MALSCSDLVTYTYRGDRLTDPRFKGQRCAAVRRPDGRGSLKCIRGRNGNMLVRFMETGETVVVLGRQLRKEAA